MDVFYNKLEADPSTIGMDVVGGRLDLVSATSIKWGFQNSNQIRLVNPDTGRWELVKCATEPTLANNATDLNGTALAVDKIYDVFAEYSSGTAFTLVASRWQTATAGTSSRVATYDAGTTYAIGDRVTYGGHDWVKQSSAAAGTTPVTGNDWVDNGTSVSGDFAGLYRHDGVLVSSSSTTGKSRRWLGIIYTYNNSGTVNFKDEDTYRYVSNFYNRVSRAVYSYNTSASYTNSSTSWAEWQGGANQVRGYFLCCFSASLLVSLTATAQQNTSSAQTSFSIILNGTGYGEAVVTHVAASLYASIKQQRAMSSNIGLNYISGRESLSAGTATVLCQSGNYGNIITNILG